MELTRKKALTKIQEIKNKVNQEEGIIESFWITINYNWITTIRRGFIQTTLKKTTWKLPKKVIPKGKVTWLVWVTFISKFLARIQSGVRIQLIHDTIQLYSIKKVW